jgi:hypothetical protein
MTGTARKDLVDDRDSEERLDQYNRESEERLGR